MGRKGETPAQFFWHIGVKKEWYKLGGGGGGVEEIWKNPKEQLLLFGKPSLMSEIC